MKISTIKNRLLNKVIILTFWLGIWEMFYLIIKQDLYLPSPFDVLKTLSILVGNIDFWQSVGYSIYKTILGILLSSVLGILFGIICSSNRFIYELVTPFIIAIKSTPIISFIIIALIWFSSDNITIFICFLMCFPIIYTNIIEGIKNIDKNLLEMAKVYNVKKAIILKNIYVPFLVPYFSAACITSIGLGWKASIAAEVLSNPKYSIGGHLYSAKVYMDSSELFAWTTVVIVISIIFEWLFTSLIKNNVVYKTKIEQ